MEKVQTHICDSSQDYHNKHDKKLQKKIRYEVCYISVYMLVTIKAKKGTEEKI
jgi:hypothetical protein